MAAPAVTARVIPPTVSSFKLPDGFKSTIAFALKPNIQFWERDLSGPGWDGGEPINTTTMLNTLWRTFAPRKLMTLTPFDVTAAFDPDIIPDIQNVFINRPDAITFRYSDNSSIAFFGYMQKFIVTQMKEGEMPLCNIAIQPTNYDWVNNVEAAPVFTPAAGT